MKVLIVDGSKQKRHDLVAALGELTNVVIQGAVSHVRSAIHAVADAQPDVIVTGVVLPDGDGTHLIERVRRMTAAPSIVVVAPQGSEEQRARYIAAGADRYVEDDKNYTELQAAISGLRICDAIAPHETLRLLGRMTAGIVHDLNNYFGVLDGSLELMNRHPGDRGELWPPVRTTLDSIHTLLRSLLAYARGGVPPMEPLDLATVVRHALVVGKRIIPTNVSLSVEIAGGLRPVTAVQSEIEQLLLNLVINACDAMPLGGELHVAVKPATQNAVLIEVSDTGSGNLMAPAAGRATSKKPGRHGTGLGLGIVHSVITRHKGALRIVDRSGGGTLVAAMFPTQTN